MNKHELCIAAMADWTATEEHLVAFSEVIACCLWTHGFDNASGVEANDLIVVYAALSDLGCCRVYIDRI